MADDDRQPAYPTHWEADVVLRDGGTAHVRPIRPADADALQAFHVGQSERSTYFRFFAPLERLGERDLTRFTVVDHVDRVALVALATVDETERIIGVGRFDRVDPSTAEVAFNISDHHQGRGVGSVLLEHLAAAARERGVRRFTAEVLPQNAAMLAVFREAGYVLSQRLDDGIVSVEFAIDPTERSMAVMADREHRAEARSVRGLLTPAAVLLVADDEGSGVARTVLAHLTASPDGPAVHVVGPVGRLPGVRTWESVADVPDHVDLLVLAVTAQRAPEVVRRATRLQPHAVVVLTGGFAETGDAGLEHQRDLVRTAHAGGMRVLGPASYGFFRQPTGTHPGVNASLAPELPPPGALALFCQSAPLAVGMLASARRRGLGLSTFLSSGNRADVSGNDAMQFWTEDESTQVVGLYLESIGNPRKFARVARRLAATKPVVVLPAGRSGHVVPPGHVVRRTRAPRRVLEEMLRQAGVIRVENTHQLLDVSQLLVHQPLPAGRRVAVVAGSAPLAALVAEAAASAGLTVVEQRAVRPTTGDAPSELVRLEAEIEEVFHHPGVDAVVVVHVPTTGEVDPDLCRLVAQGAARSGLTTVATILGHTGVTAALTAEDPDGHPRTVPAYAAPEDGVLALAAAARFGAWRTADRGTLLDLDDVDRTRARALVRDALATRGAPEQVVTLGPDETAALLGCYGVEVWPTRVVDDVEAAVRAAEELGWPVALKSTAQHLRHRIDLGGVRLDVAGPQALRESVEQMRTHLAKVGERGTGLEVQRMAPSGAACVIRSAEDPRFGPVVSFGLAGDAVDLLGDVSYGVAPLTGVDVTEMVRSVRAAPRLFGYRGLPPLDVAAVEDVLGRVAVMADDLPELHGLELHPVVVHERGASVLAARIELSTEPGGRADSGRRTLPE